MKETLVEVSQIRTGMVVSRDIYTDNDLFLIAENTVIQHNHILKLELYRVHAVHILAQEEKTSTISVSPSEAIPISETEEFLQFTINYEEKVDTLNNYYLDIIHTGHVEISGLTELAEDVMTRVKTSGELFSFLCRLNEKDDVTLTHALNVAMLATVFAKWLNFSEADLQNITLAGLLHDIGKTKVPNHILKKPGPLTPSEFETMKNHTVFGYQLLTPLNLHPGITQAALMHHEKMNKNGYPFKVPWEQIHPYAKVIGIVDFYDAVTSNRPYRKKLHPFKAIKLLEEEGYGVFDTEYLYTFLNHIASYYLGNAVRLSDGRQGKIVFIPPQMPSKPLIEVPGGLIDMSQENDLSILEFI